LSATPAVYLNALEGKGVHVVTVNDYLAKRDSEWMSPIYHILGLSVGNILTTMENDERRENYAKDITYGTNNEFGFDYLRDNMVFEKEYKVQREFNYCIVDEIDSVLIDEARTPLIISGAAENDTKHIINARKFVAFFKECEKNPDGRYPDEADPFNPQKPVGDYKKDEKSKNVTFTDDGMNKLEKLLQDRNIIKGSLYNQENFEYVHYMTQALRAELMFHIEVDYLVRDNEVQIIDEHTGRVLPGRRYSDGLHQAIEAKENITVQRRSKTFASITFQNFFRMYKKLSGMTGTADTEAGEFKNIYNLDVVVIPTNVPVSRIDNSDRIYLNFKDKSKAVVEEIKELHKKGQPVLIGTISVEKSEIFSSLLKKANVRHNVLNAKNHAREAEIISEAGRVGAVTIATNMAGRGTDIKLGGERKYDEHFEALLQEEDIAENEKHIILEIKELIDRLKLEEAKTRAESLGNTAKKGINKIVDLAYDWIEENKRVKEVGGLFILGTERHEARRIDNQLRGRSGRQGDPGESRFYISMDDDLMRLFGGEKLQKMLSGIGMKEGELIEHPWITGAIEKSQKRVESRNFEIRKHLLEYDDVLNKQRVFIYQKRDEILEDSKIIERVFQSTEEILEDFINDYHDNMKKGLDVVCLELTKNLKNTFFIEPVELIKKYQNDPKTLYENILTLLKDELSEKDRILGHDYLNMKLRELYLILIDRSWQDHLENMEQLREAVYLRSYSQKNPLIEYKIEGSTMFEELIQKIKDNVVNQIYRIKIETVSALPHTPNYSTQKNDYNAFAPSVRQGRKETAEEAKISTTVINKGDKIGRNEPCPCGSGKKYKQCCGK
ncbi:MAG TPA: preprotein translocase subunit SecA, partial [Spirochaetota bacterium]|nr:preprotein translocase subunit SecA [Spirochaetota bacterium]